MGETLRIESTAGGAILAVRVIPRAPRSKVTGVRSGALLVRLAAAPVEGAANDALIAFLADVLQVARSQLALVSGGRSRDKRVRVALDAHAVEQRLAPHLR